MSDNYLELAKILSYSTLAFFIALWWAPSLIRVLNWLKFWKKKSRLIDTNGEKLIVTKQFYIENEEKRLIPRAGGLLIWVTTLAFAGFFWILLKIEPENKLFQYLNFVSRTQTFIPLGTLFFASIFGFIDDVLATMDDGGNYKAGGLKLTWRLTMVATLSLAIGLWFYFKLNITSFDLFGFTFNMHNLFGLDLGWLIIPITMLVLVSLWVSSVIDGFDGIATGTLIPVYLCFAGLAYAGGYYNIATLLVVMVGTMAAFLWFNIPPAKFILGDTGTMGMLLTLGTIAIFINKIYILPISGIMLVLTAASVVIQVLSKKFFKRKIFLAAPLHHHFEAKGLKREQITLRYWIISFFASLLGLIIGLLLK